MTSKVAFRTPDHFSRASEQRPYQLLPFRFMHLDGRVFLANEVGEYHFLTTEIFHDLVSRSLARDSSHYRDLKSKHFLFDSTPTLPIRLLATKYRTKRSFLAGFTRLHIVVVSLRCDHSCHYCQVSRVSPDKRRYDMSPSTALLAVDAIFRSPAPQIKIEFQGGEPLLNFDVIKQIVKEAKQRNSIHGKDIEFVITSNLAFLTDDVLTFCRDERILLSTSLDGPAFIHNANRPRPEANSYELTLRGIEKARSVLGYDKVSAIMTTSRLTLEYPLDVVDEYVRRGFDSVFLRPISPYGFAVKSHHRIGYETEAFVTFYKKALAYIIELNRRGTFFIESYAQILLTKILTPYPTGYVDLQSPSGAGIGAVVYNYDGNVYVSDEARMLSEMGDDTFRLGHLNTDSYESMFGGQLLRSIVAASCVESLPQCADCAFQTYCGCDPVENHATQGNIFGHRPTSSFCHRNMEIIKHLLRLYEGNDSFVRKMFWSWIHDRPVSDLLPTLPGEK